MNTRGHYGNGRVRPQGVPQVGLVHTPQDTEDEINQLHAEIMQFGEEAAARVRAATQALEAQPGYQALRNAVRDADAYYQSIGARPAEEIARRIARAMQLPALSTRTLTESWVADAVKLPNVVRADADLARDHATFLQQVAAVRRLNAAQTALANAYNQLRSAGSAPILAWSSDAWEPFRTDWLSWRSGKIDVPGQTWPGSGTWDRVQDYRAKYIDLRDHAPFETIGPAPLRPEDRRDPSLLGGLSDFASTFKWVAIGVLGVGGILAATALASNLKKRRS